MTIRISDITTKELNDIALGASIEHPAANLDHVLLRGLPDSARLSSSERQADGSWKIAPTDIEDVRLTLSGVPKDSLVLQLVERDPAGQLIGEAATFRITVSATAAPKRCPEWTKVLGAFVLVAFSILIFICWRLLYVNAQGVLTRDWCVSWEKPQGIVLQSAPITFWYDPTAKMLHHRGPIDANLKQTLLKLAQLIPEKGAQAAPATSGGGSVND